MSLSSPERRCDRCDQIGHRKNSCTAILTAEEESAIAKSMEHVVIQRRRIASRRLWKLKGTRVNKERREARRTAYTTSPKETWLKEVFRPARRRAKRLGLPYDQEIPDLELPDYCPILGLKLNYGFQVKTKSNSPSLDRIVPSRGYVKANLRVISYRANTLKNNASFDEIRRVYLDMERLAKKGNSGMLKRDEIEHPESCFNKARDSEHLFVLLARDPAAPITIRAWVAERLRLGKNMPNDPQIREALDCAALMDLERAEIESTRRQQQMHWAEGGVAP